MADPTARRHHQRDPQAAVRVGQFERSLEQFNREMAQKMTLFVAEFHERYVKPLRLRIEYLEMPLWKRVWLKVPLIVQVAKIRLGIAPPAKNESEKNDETHRV